MTEYRTAILGGRRGVRHARAYRGIENMTVVGICEQDADLRRWASEALGIPGFADYIEMLRDLKPDIVHAVTNPGITRGRWVRPAAEHGVKALVIEKPLALRPSEREALVHAAEAAPELKIIVNHQRRYMPFADRLRQLLAEGALGDIHFVRASSQGEIMDMATHLMDVALMALGDAAPTHVWAAVHGAETYSDSRLNCPESLMAQWAMPGGQRLFFEVAKEPLGSADYRGADPRCNIDVWGSSGRFYWRENGAWGVDITGEGGSTVFPTSFPRDDEAAQTAFTRAIGAWLDGGEPHHCRLELALLGFDAIMAAYQSAYYGRRIEITTPFSDEGWARLKERVMEQGS